jgi:hypothetical protein
MKSLQDEEYQTEEEKERLTRALQQVDNLVITLSDNESKDYLYNQLFRVKCELDRQLNCLCGTSPYELK